MEGHVVNRDAQNVWTEVRQDASDDRLVGAARLGDPEAFAVLYQRYKLDVWQLAWFTLRDHHDAEDVLQETFLKAHRALGQYRRDETFRPWLLTICRNACRDRLRVAQRRDVVALDEDTAVSPWRGDPERSIDFHRALTALPEEDREAFLLVDVLGCRSEEAAEIVGLRASSTLRSRLGRARRALAPAVAEPPLMTSGPELWGLYHSPRQSAVVLCEAPNGDGHHAGALLARLLDPTPAAGTELVDFLERLDRCIPVGRNVVAVVDERPAGAAPWLAGHPRWRMQRAPTHQSWVGEVDALLSRCVPCTAQDRDRLRAVLSAETAFVWTGDA
jgi:RNA polymerase sigma-70 factor (ECF subfamily)